MAYFIFSEMNDTIYAIRYALGSIIGRMRLDGIVLLVKKYLPEADFSEADMELKCTPLNKGAKEQLLIKERLVCNMIDYMEVVNEDFEHSHFYSIQNVG